MMKYQLVNTHLISFLWNYFLWNLMKLYIMIIAWYSMQFFIRISKFLLFNNIFVLNCYFYLVWGILLFHIFFLFMSLHNFFFSFHHISLKNSILLLILKQFFSNIIMFHIILIHNFIKPSLLLLSNLINQLNLKSLLSQRAVSQDDSILTSTRNSSFKLSYRIHRENQRQ